MTDGRRTAAERWERPPPPPSRRWWTLAAVAAVLVIGIGALLLPLDAQPTLTVGPTPARGGAPLTDVDPRDFVQERLAPVQTTTERPGTGAVLPGDQVDLTIIAVDDTGLHLLDTDTGDLRRIAVRRPSPASLSETVLVIGDAIVVEADADVVALRRSAVRPTRIAEDHRVVPTVDDRSVWVFDDASPYVAGTASRIGLDGTVHTQIPLPAVAEPVVGTADGLVVSTPGAVTLIGDDGTRRPVVRGMAVAADGQRLAWLACADDLSCSVTIGTVDDPAQVRTALDPTVLPPGFFGLPTGAFSPDGRWLALPLYEGGRGLEDVTVSVIDTETGIEAFRAAGSSRIPFATPLAWSPDSAWLIFVSGSDLRGWSAVTRRATTLDVELGGIRALAVR